MEFRMPVWTNAVMIALLGVGVLTHLSFAPHEGTRFVAALVLPWDAGGVQAVVAANLPLIDLRWRGHVMILDTGGDAAVLARLRHQGFWLLDATGARGCDVERDAG